MLKRKPKTFTPEQTEEIRTKDFFDMILPGTVKFLSDRYILGDSYRCVWAIREYPPSTEEQVILSRLADKSGVTLRIYHRLVDSMEQRKIIQNAARKNKLKSGGNDVTEAIEAESNLQDLMRLVANQKREQGLLLHCSVFIELKARSMDTLKELQSEIAMEKAFCLFCPWAPISSEHSMNGYCRLTRWQTSILSTSPARPIPMEYISVEISSEQIFLWTSTAAPRTKQPQIF